MHDMPHWRRFRNNLRLIDSGAGEGGSVDPATGDPADPGDPATGDPANTGEDIDWKAKFEEQRAHSRKWEQRAKDNSKAAEELQQFKDSQLSEAEKAAKRIKELEAANAAYEAERQQNEWKAQVSKETGVPASLLHGDTLEAMTANAKAIDQYAHPKPKGMPNQGKTPDGKAAGADERAWADDLFSNL